MLVIFAGLSSAFFGSVGNSHLATGTSDTLDLQFVSADALDDLSFMVLELENTTVIVIQNHDSSHMGNAQLQRRHHFTVHVHVGNVNSVLASGVGDTDVEMFIFLKNVVIQDLQFDLLFSHAGTEGQSARATNVVIGGAGSTVFGLVINEDRLVQITTLTNNGHEEFANIFQNSEVRRVEADPLDTIVLLLVNSSHSIGGFLLFLFGFGGLGCQTLLHSLVQVALAGQFAGSCCSVMLKLKHEIRCFF